MGQDRTRTVSPGTYSGNSKVYSAGPDGLAAQLRNLMAMDASARAINGATTDFVGDSSASGKGAIVTFDETGGTVEDQVTLSNATLGVPTGHPVVFRNTGGGLPTGITAGTTYYVIRVSVGGSVSTSIFQIATSALNARTGIRLEFTGDGTGTNYIQRQVALPDAPVTHDSLGATTGLLDTQMKATADTLMEALASAVNILAPMQVDLGMPVVDIGGLTGASTVAAIDTTATANTTDDDAADFTSVVTCHDEVNNAIRTVAAHVNDLAAAVGQDEYLEFLSPHGVEAADPATVGIDGVTAATSAVGGAAATVELTKFNQALVVWSAAVGAILQRVSVVSATAQGVDHWTRQLVPSATQVQQVLPGLYTRQR